MATGGLTGDRDPKRVVLFAACRDLGCIHTVLAKAHAEWAKGWKA